MSYVFISHANKDKAQIRFIVDAVIAAGLKVWLDNPLAMGYAPDQIAKNFHHLTSGRYRDSIDEALRTAGAVLVCWSERAMEDRDVWFSEASVARTLQKLVACRIDDVDAGLLPDEHGNEQIADLRLHGTVDQSGKPAPRSEAAISAQLKLLISALKDKIASVTLGEFSRRVDRKVHRDVFVPYLVDRTEQEASIGAALDDVMAQGGARAFILAGPENECPDEFVERLKRHTSPRRLDGQCWYQIHTEWPFERSPAEFSREYVKRLALQLGIPTSATNETIARALAARGRPVAVLSLLHAEEWLADEISRVEAWTEWWKTASAQAIRFSAIPILCVKFSAAAPGWREYPQSEGTAGRVSNRQICRDLKSLRQPRKTFGFWPFKSASAPEPSVSVPPLLQPVRRPDADRWLQEWFEVMTADYLEAKGLLETIFAQAQAARNGVSLRDFATAVEVLYRERQSN